MPTRRALLAYTGASAAILSVPAARAVASEPLSAIANATIRGSIDAAANGLRTGTQKDQSTAFAAILEEAAATGSPVFLPPGTYRVANIVLPERLHLAGILGETRLVFAGNGFFLRANGANTISLSGLVVDAGGRPFSEGVQGALDLRGVSRLSIDQCSILDSAGYGIATERCAGSIERSTVSNAAEAGFYCVDSNGMRIADNTISECGNGGILVHRWEAGEDGTIVSGNRVERIRADAGGTGQNGNGINVYRAGNVIVSDNQVSDCAFSAIRANSASDVQITGNNCRRSGETAIYSEFAFQGAVISSNMVDGAANGISMVNLDKGGRMAACTGNIVRNLTRDGPYPADPPGFGVGINVEADSTVTGNVVESAPTFGMAIGWGPFMRNVAVSGNVVRKAGVGVAVSVVEGAGAASISGNIFSDIENGAVVGYRWTDPATDDLTREGAELPAQLSVSGNQVS